MLTATTWSHLGDVADAIARRGPPLPPPAVPHSQRPQKQRNRPIRRFELVLDELEAAAAALEGSDDGGGGGGGVDGFRLSDGGDIARGGCSTNPLECAAARRSPIVRLQWCHSHGDALPACVGADRDRVVRVPRPIDPISALPASRFHRKRQQLANMVAIISLAAPFLHGGPATWPRGPTTPPLIVDFCSGAGHLGLLLAVCFPQCRVIVADWNVRSLELAEERRRKARLTNVEVLRCDIHRFSRVFDLGVALHACGDLTDRAISHCLACNASYVVCPCCVGKLHAGTGAGAAAAGAEAGVAGALECSGVGPMPFPRSHKMASILDVKQFEVLAAAADFNAHSGGGKGGEEGEGARRSLVAQETEMETERDAVLRKRRRRCKWWMEIDRSVRAEEAGWRASLYRMCPLSASPKNDILVARKVRV
jgi:hypothetical protein